MEKSTSRLSPKEVTAIVAEYLRTKRGLEITKLTRLSTGGYSFQGKAREASVLDKSLDNLITTSPVWRNVRCKKFIEELQLYKKISTIGNLLKYEPFQQIQPGVFKNMGKVALKALAEGFDILEIPKEKLPLYFRKK